MSPAADERALVAFLERSGEWLAAECAPAEVERLRRADHDVVRVRGRSALLLTYHLWSEPPPDPPRVYVLFRHTQGHPPAPDDVQRTIERLLY